MQTMRKAGADMSLSSRRAWIEIMSDTSLAQLIFVALLTESVD